MRVVSEKEGKGQGVQGKRGKGKRKGGPRERVRGPKERERGSKGKGGPIMDQIASGNSKEVVGIVKR